MNDELLARTNKKVNDEVESTHVLLLLLLSQTLVLVSACLLFLTLHCPSFYQFTG